MSSETPADREPAPDEARDDTSGAAGGVFGNLPQTRPGARSPRRERGGNGAPRAGAARAKPRAKRTGAGARGKPRATTGAKARPARPAPEADGPAGPREPAPEARDDAARSGGGIEDVAWAGVAAAAEAATIGVRLATRALEAMRDAVDRR